MNSWRANTCSLPVAQSKQRMCRRSLEYHSLFLIPMFLCLFSKGHCRDSLANSVPDLSDGAASRGEGQGKCFCSWSGRLDQFFRWGKGHFRGGTCAETQLLKGWTSRMQSANELLSRDSHGQLLSPSHWSRRLHCGGRPRSVLEDRKPNRPRWRHQYTKSDVHYRLTPNGRHH